MTKKNSRQYKVIRDTQEKKGYWDFQPSDVIEKTESESMTTGDYTIAGMEDIFSLERKASTGELAGNINTRRFHNEMKRGDKLKHFWIICEFSLADVLKFPYSSGIPPKIWPKLRLNGPSFLKKLVELEVNYGVKIIFAGNRENAQVIALSIFKRMIEKYANKIN